MISKTSQSSFFLCWKLELKNMRPLKHLMRVMAVKLTDPTIWPITDPMTDSMTIGHWPTSWPIPWPTLWLTPWGIPRPASRVKTNWQHGWLHSRYQWCQFYQIFCIVSKYCSMRNGQQSWLKLFVWCGQRFDQLRPCHNSILQISQITQTRLSFFSGQSV